MGNYELNEELAEKVAEFLLKIPDEVWDELFDQLPEFQKMPEEFKNWPFGNQAVVLMVGALNDYRINSEKYWEKFYGTFQTQPRSPEDMKKLLEQVFCRNQKSKNEKPQKCGRMERFFENEGKKFVGELWEKNETYFKENIGGIWEKLADVMSQPKEAKTIILAIKDLVILLMKRTGDTGILDSLELPVLVDSRIQKLTKNLVSCNNDLDVDKVRSFWKDVLDLINKTRAREGKDNLTMIHLDTLLWFIGGDCSKLFSLLVRKELKRLDD